MRNQLLLALVLLGSAAPARADRPTAAAVNQFAVDSYRAQSPHGNLFFSPRSIATTFAMLDRGARGQTDAQLRRAFHLTGHESFKPYAGQSGFELREANRIWPQAGISFLPTFIEALKSHFAASLVPLDFRGNPEGARHTINTWVERQTAERIKDLLPPGAIMPLTRLVLTNAIYFKASWAQAFDKKRTESVPFHASGHDLPCRMMRQDKPRTFAYTETPDLQLVELPYQDCSLAMDVVLPKRPDGLSAVEAQLGNLPGWLSGMTSKEVALALPRTTLTMPLNLAALLQKLGVTDVFGQAADLSGIDGKRDLYVSVAVHKAFLAMDEEGTEAAAATAVVVATRSIALKPMPVIFQADHPFLFLIRDRSDGAILFMGRLETPVGGNG